MTPADPRGAALARQFEGCRLRAYLPTPRDRPTIGWGLTFYPDGRAVAMGDSITQAQADADFETMFGRFVADVQRRCGPATPAQLGAMACLAYNIGMRAFARSTVLLRHIAGNHAGAAVAFALWDKQAGRVLPGLIRRRAAEAALYRGDA